MFFDHQRQIIEYLKMEVDMGKSNNKKKKSVTMQESEGGSMK